MTTPDSLAAHLGADAPDTAVLHTERPAKSAVVELADSTSAETSLAAADVDLEASLPPDAALLRVFRSLYNGKSVFGMHFTFGGYTESAPDDESADDLLAVLQTIPEACSRAADSSGKTGNWQDAYFKTLAMWKSNPSLTRWIHQIFTVGIVDPYPSLTVRDNTAFGIPWELYYKQAFHVGPNPSPESGWLGALTRVVRWVTLAEGGVTGRELATPACWTAGLLMLEDKDLHQPDDKFDDYLVQQPRTADMFELLDWLENCEDPFGMVLIRCHGIFDEDPSKLVLFGIPYNRYEAWGYRKLAECAPLVFLNVCAGARASGGLAGHPVSFSELFLRKGASGVIAATADIDADHSWAFAEELLSDACRAEQNIAEWIRSRRADYAADVAAVATTRPDSQNDHEADFKRFFEAFKIVYFGHPDSTLRSLRDSSAGAGST